MTTLRAILAVLAFVSAVPAIASDVTADRQAQKVTVTSTDQARAATALKAEMVKTCNCPRG